MRVRLQQGPLIRALIFSVIALSVLGCNRSSSPTSGSPSQVQASTAKRYHLKGKVVSIDKPSKMAIIDGESIPGFMEAMTMPYQVKPESELDKLSPGDMITADVVVEDENGWLENIVVTGHAAQPSKP
jgi:protein SCO1/2